MVQQVNLAANSALLIPQAFTNPLLPRDLVGGGKRQYSEGLAGSEEIRQRLATRARSALTLLLEAREYAQEIQCSGLDFAVPAAELASGGLTSNDLRWLIFRKLVAAPAPSENHGENAFPGSTQATVPLAKEAQYVLTDAGAAFVECILRQSGKPSSQLLSSSPASIAAMHPHWDAPRQELSIGNVLVKQFKVPAANQERILAVFEEEGWPPRIDDPLPGVEESRRKRRLHDTINSLNRGQRVPLMRFLGDGKGEGVRWELRQRSEFGTLFQAGGD